MVKRIFILVRPPLKSIVLSRRIVGLLLTFSIFSATFQPVFCSQDPVYLKGFPLEFENHYRAIYHGASTVVSNFDRSGSMEIFFALHKPDNTKLYLVHSDGSFAENWPVNLFNTRVPPAIAAGDIDNDGFLDAVVRAESLYVFSHDGIILPGFPVNIYHEHLPFVAIYDLDADGSLEIITVGNNRLYVLNSIGIVKSGWPVTLPGNWNEVFVPPPAIGNIDSDPEAEIVAVSAYCFGSGVCDSSYIHIFNHNGSYAPGWPVKMDSGYTFYSQSPTILPGNSNSIVLVNSALYFPPNFDSTRTKTSVYKGNGSLLSEVFTTSFGECSSIPVSVKNADTLLAFGSEPLSLFISNRTNNTMLSLIGNGYYYNSPAVLEIYSKTYFTSYLRTIDLSLRCSVYFYDEKGQQAEWSPLRPIGIPAASLSIADLNYDGKTEAVMLTNLTSNNTPKSILHVWTFPESHYNIGKAYWPMYGHDRFRTFQYAFVPPDEPVNIIPLSSSVPEKNSLHQNFPNPFNSTTNITFEIAEISDVQIEMYDNSGKRMSSIVNRKFQPGVYRIPLSADGFASGVYFIRMKVGEEIFGKKIIMIK